MSPQRWAVAALAVCVLIGCGDDPAPKDAPGEPGDPASLQAEWLSAPLTDPPNTCDIDTAQIGGDSIPVHLWRSRAVSDDALRDRVTGIRRYYGHLDVNLTTDRTRGLVAMKYGINNDIRAASAAMQATGVDLDQEPLSDSDALLVADAIGRTLFKGVRKFIKDYSVTGDTAVRIVVLDQIAHPGAERGMGLIFGGIGISEALLQRVGDDQAIRTLETMLGLTDAEFSPTLFIGDRSLRLLVNADTADWVSAHEMGHALGLIHVTDTNNLMHPTAKWLGCMPVLAAAQADSLVGVAAFLRGLSVEDCGVSRLRELAAFPRRFMRALRAGEF